MVVVGGRVVVVVPVVVGVVGAIGVSGWATSGSGAAAGFGAMMRFDGGAGVDARVGLQVADLVGLGQHEAQLGGGLLDALAVGELCDVLAQARVLALVRRRRGRPRG